MSAHPTVEAFIANVKQILAEDGSTEPGLQRVADQMKTQLLSDPELTSEEAGSVGNVHAGQQSAPIYKDESGLTLVRARFGPEEMTPIHSHGSWGVIGVYKGKDRYQIWHRLDSGTGPGEAVVELVEERILEAGETVVMPPPPQDIHAQQGHDGAATHEFVLFGKNTMSLPRLFFDPERSNAVERLPGER